MSALPPEADMLIVGINVCYVPIATSPCFKAFRKSGYCAFHRHKVEGAIPKHLAIRV